MQQFEFNVQGSAETPYLVRFFARDGQLFGTCTCPAGELAQMCKHRTAVLTGDVVGVIAGAETLPTLARLLPGTALEAALQAVAAGEADVDRAKRALTAAKKQLSLVIEPRSTM